MKLIAAAFACFLRLVPAQADIIVEAGNGGQNSVGFQVLTQADVTLTFDVLGGPTAANCAPVDPDQTQPWGCLGALTQTASMGLPVGYGVGGAYIQIQGGYQYYCQRGCGFIDENISYDCDGGTCGSLPNVPCSFTMSGAAYCTTTLAPGSYSIFVSDNDSLASAPPGYFPGNSMVTPFSESVEATLTVQSGIVTTASTPEPGSLALLLSGLVVVLWRCRTRAIPPL